MPEDLDEEIVNNLYEEAEECESNGHFEEALSLYKDIKNISPSDELRQTIERVEDLALQYKFSRGFKQAAGTPLQSTPHCTQTEPSSALVDRTLNETINQTIALVPAGQLLDAERYNNLILDGRALYKEDDLENALNKYEEAYSLHSDSKLQRRIAKIQKQLKQSHTTSFVNSVTNAPINEDLIDKYNDFVIEASDCIDSSNKEEALRLYRMAYDIDSTPKLKEKITALEAELESSKTADQDPDESTDEIAHYNSLIREAKSKLSDEQYELSLQLYEEANEINPSDKLQKRIKKIRDFLEFEQQEEESESHEESTISNDADMNKSTMKAEGDDLCSSVVEEAKKFEEEQKFAEAIDAYREAQSLKPCPYFISKIEELEKKLVINEANQAEEDPEVEEQAEDAEEEPEAEESELDVGKYNELIIEGREMLDSGDLQGAIQKYQAALERNFSEKLEKRIGKIRKKIEEDRAEEEGDDEQEDVDPEIKEYYDATISDAKTKEENFDYDQAIALYEEANELIPSEKLSQKIASLEFERDSERDSERKPQKPQTLDELSSKEKVKYNEYINKGKYSQKESKFEKALGYFQKAYTIYGNEKLDGRIKKLEKFLLEEAEAEGLYTDMGDGIFLGNDVHEKLYEYQREGVKWMWNLYRAEHGGILGDDMGLGKTIQTIAYIQAVFMMDQISSALMVMPLSLIDNWQAEFKKWAPELRVELFHGSKAERERNVKRVMRKGGIALTTYGIIEKNVEFLVTTGFKWDYLILDEGHKIKNPTKTSKAMRNVPCSNRLLISGTPIQNNLKELWALFDFVSRGKLLGTMTTFKMNYITPIERGREKDASKAEARLGAKLAENLRKLIDPYFLRRTKAEIKRGNKGASTGVSRLGKKNELCVWLKLSEAQHGLYEAFLTLDTVKDAMNTSRSPLAALTVLKKICDHPRLAIKFEALRDVMDAENMNMKPQDHQKLLSKMELPPDPSNDLLLEEACKLKFAIGLLDMLTNTGHRTLLFSTSLKILNYIQSMIGEKGIRCLRIDGSINKPGERQQIIDKFNADERFSVLLLTTQVGGVGLNLTSADRVVIYDPNWNPATDAQAVDRAYRIGQTKPVIVYRLLTSGTIEEKIYRKQVFKDSITRQATGDSLDPIRYFTNQEISQLFILGSTDYSETCNQLEELHGAARNHSDQVKTDILELARMGAIACSDHDLLFSHEEKFENTPEERKYVEDRVEQANKNLALDSAGSRPAPPNPRQGGHHEPGGYDPRATAMPLNSAPRQSQESARGDRMWEQPTGRENYESPYFQPNTAPSFQPQQVPSTPPRVTATHNIINIDDDDDEVLYQPTFEQKKKLSLSDYKRKQMKIYDYASPVPQPDMLIRPSPPRSNPVGEIIEKHLLTTPRKRREVTSDDEVEDVLDSSRYDNLNKPACLDDDEEEEEEEYHDAEQGSNQAAEDEVEEEEEGNSTEETEKKEKVESLTNLMGGFRFNSPHNSPKPDGSKESYVETPDMRSFSEERQLADKKQDELKKLQTERREVQKQAEEREQDREKQKREEEREKQQKLQKQAEEREREKQREKQENPRHQGNKENVRTEEKNKVKSRKSANESAGGCTCGRMQAAIDKGYRVVKCKCMCTPEEEEKYNKYLARGLEHHKSGNASKALQYYKAALQQRNEDITVQKAYLALKKQAKG